MGHSASHSQHHIFPLRESQVEGRHTSAPPPHTHTHTHTRTHAHTRRPAEPQQSLYSMIPRQSFSAAAAEQLNSELSPPPPDNNTARDHSSQKISAWRRGISKCVLVCVLVCAPCDNTGAGMCTTAHS